MYARELRPLWQRFFNFNWKFGLFLILIVCIPRFILVLNANASANYSYIDLIMVISAIAPFVFLNRCGRKAIGITKPRKLRWLFYAFILGLIASTVLYLLGEIIYAHSFKNWYHYIGRSYNIPDVISSKDKAMLFIIMASTGLIFSPIGEELFFRGIVHGSFKKSIGEKRACAIDSAAFALTHIAHFGLIFIDGEWLFLKMPTLIWVLSMFFVSLLFTICKRYSGSLLGAISCHSAFNLGMIYCIFYLI